MTWEECAAAGMTLTEAAKARGRSVAAASKYALDHGLTFRKGEHRPPVWTPEMRAAQSARMRERWRNGEFRDRASDALKARWREGGNHGPNSTHRLPFSRTDKIFRTYQKMRAGGVSRAEALKALGVEDTQR